jgi:hypothetical protein
MSETTPTPTPKADDLRMSAYYYAFEPTGCRPVDAVLSAVACAGKAYHYTADWTEPCSPYEDVHRGVTPIDWIQNAAVDAARELAAARAEVETYRDSCAAKADRIDRLGETVVRLRGEVEGLQSVVQSVAVTELHKLPGGDECVCTRCELVLEARAALAKEKAS